MGDCYSVEMEVRLRKGKSASKLAQIMHKWMLAQEKDVDCRLGVNWAWSDMRKAGLRPTSLPGICKILLAFQQGGGKETRTPDGAMVFSNAFNASYGWGSVMVEAFERMLPHLEEGSRLEMDRDDGYEDYCVRRDESGKRCIRAETRSWR